MRIQVTDRDIAKGKRGDCEACAIALALRRQWARKASTSTCYADNGKTYGTKGYVEAELPPSVSQFINDFDCGRPVIPFTFELEVA